MMQTISPITVLLATPICLVTACIAKLIYKFTSAKPFDVSRNAYIKRMSTYLNRECLRDGFTVTWALGGSVHVLCRYSTIFSGEPPIFIIPSASKCSLDYMKFIKSIPKYHDVFCIDLPGWGISEPLLNVDLSNDPLPAIFKSYAVMIYKMMTEMCPIHGQTFTLVGDAFGAYLLTHAISSGIIPMNKINKFILCEPPGLSKNTLRQPYLRGIPIKMGLLNALTNTWFFRHICSAFLYNHSITLDTLLWLRHFIPGKHGYKMLSRNIRLRGILPPQWDITIKDSLVEIVKEKAKAKVKMSIFIMHGLRDSVVSYRHAKELCEETKYIKYVECWSCHDLLSYSRNFHDLFRILQGTSK
jgi:pimeloyl-ACP methyl ester carboxylesterase